MIEVHVEIDIERPADEVFAFVSDMANNTSWQNGMRSCRPMVARSVNGDYQRLKTLLESST